MAEQHYPYKNEIQLTPEGAAGEATVTAYMMFHGSTQQIWLHLAEGQPVDAKLEVIDPRDGLVIASLTLTEEAPEGGTGVWVRRLFANTSVAGVAATDAYVGHIVNGRELKLVASACDPASDAATFGFDQIEARS